MTKSKPPYLRKVRLRKFWEKHYKLLKIKNRITFLKKEIAIPALVCFVSILAIEFIFSNTPAKHKWQSEFGQVYLKFCYSYCSAFIFYYIVIYTPRERRKINLWIVLNNKTKYIDREIGYLFDEISKASSVKIDLQNPKEVTEDIMKEALGKIKPFHPLTVNEMGFVKSYANWYDYLYNKRDTIRRYILEIAIHADIVDAELLGYLTIIENSFQLIRKDHSIGGSDLTYLSFFFRGLPAYVELMSNRFHKVYQKYYLEFKVWDDRGLKTISDL
jgi:hypothetical protein